MSAEGGPRGPSWPPEIEGAITAHRRILEILLSTLAVARGDGTRLLDEIEDRIGYRDAHEDPGAEPDLAYSIERASDGELRRLLRSAREMVRTAGDGGPRD